MAEQTLELTGICQTVITSPAQLQGGKLRDGHSRVTELHSWRVSSFCKPQLGIEKQVLDESNDKVVVDLLVHSPL